MLKCLLDLILVCALARCFPATLSKSQCLSSILEEITYSALNYLLILSCLMTLWGTSERAAYAKTAGCPRAKLWLNMQLNGHLLWRVVILSVAPLSDEAPVKDSQMKPGVSRNVLHLDYQHQDQMQPQHRCSCWR